MSQDAILLTLLFYPSSICPILHPHPLLFGDCGCTFFASDLLILPEFVQLCIRISYIMAIADALFFLSAVSSVRIWPNLASAFLASRKLRMHFFPSDRTLCSELVKILHPNPLFFAVADALFSFRPYTLFRTDQNLTSPFLAFQQLQMHIPIF